MENNQTNRNENIIPEVFDMDVMETAAIEAVVEEGTVEYLTDEVLAKEDLSPAHYFEFVKNKRQKTSDSFLDVLYTNCLHLLNKCKITGQISAARKILFQMGCIEKERRILAIGIDTFVYEEDIEEYIDNVAGNTVKIIELERYEREIPDDIVLALEKVKPYFSKFYVVYTDYTGKEEKRTQQERRDKDPILFGVFQDTAHRSICNRFYYIGDWVDDYCDLTLDKMIADMEASGHAKIDHTIQTPNDLKAFEEELSKLEETTFGFRRVETSRATKKSMIRELKTFLTRKSDKS